jgi:aspartate aminotransferase-like enzyme
LERSYEQRNNPIAQAAGALRRGAASVGSFLPMIGPVAEGASAIERLSNAGRVLNQPDNHPHIVDLAQTLAASHETEVAKSGVRLLAGGAGIALHAPLGLAASAVMAAAPSESDDRQRAERLGGNEVDLLRHPDFARSLVDHLAVATPRTDSERDFREGVQGIATEQQRAEAREHERNREYLRQRWGADNIARLATPKED